MFDFQLWQVHLLLSVNKYWFDVNPSNYWFIYFFRFIVNTNTPDGASPDNTVDFVVAKKYWCGFFFIYSVSEQQILLLV